MKTVEKLARIRKRLDICRERKEDHIRALVRYQTEIPILVKTIERLERRHEREMIRRANAAAPKPAEAAPVVEAVGTMLAEHGDGLSIPDYLKRTPTPTEIGARAALLSMSLAADIETAAAIKAENDTRKKEKARVRIEHMKAKKAGETRRMPLTGKAAMKAIKNELSLGHLGPLP